MREQSIITLIIANKKAQKKQSHRHAQTVLQATRELAGPNWARVSTWSPGREGEVMNLGGLNAKVLGSLVSAGDRASCF